jgi:hypothetical protein
MTNIVKVAYEFLEALNDLKPESKPLWGKMTAQHMVEHLIFAVQMGNEKLFLECFNPPEKLPLMKRILMSNKPLPKLFVNPVIGSDLMELKYHNLEEAKSNLRKEADDYYSYFEKNPGAKLVNVTFGELNFAEWEVFHKKHFSHHFNQFGLLSSDK